MPLAIQDTTEGQLIEADLEQEEILLLPWLNTFTKLYGIAPVLQPFAGGRTLTIPRVVQPIELLGSNGHFREHPAMMEYVRRFGFGWEADGRILTMPTPATFNRQLAAVGPPKTGFRVGYTIEDGPSVALGPWLSRYLDGLLTVQVSRPPFYARYLRDGPVALRFPLCSLAHDLTVHALNYHLVPHEAVRWLAQCIRAALPERLEGWKQPGANAPVTLTYFYDNDLNRYIYGIWNLTAQPEEFAKIFTRARNFSQLAAALHVRIRETKAGKGDVASGDFNHMQLPEPTHFELQ